jgi:hypothetical protein
LVWADRIERRQALRLAQETELNFIAAASAQGGKQSFNALQSVLRNLRDEPDKPIDAAKVARQLGLRRRSRKGPPDGADSR